MLSDDKIEILAYNIETILSEKIPLLFKRWR